MDDDCERGLLMHRTVTRPANDDDRRVFHWNSTKVRDWVESFQLLETEMNGQLQPDGNGKSNWGQTRFSVIGVRLDFHSSNARRASVVRGALVRRCPRAFQCMAPSTSAPLEESPGASHVAEVGVRVEMMKNRV
jgi:hypothetical protein